MPEETNLPQGRGEEAPEGAGTPKAGENQQATQTSKPSTDNQDKTLLQELMSWKSKARENEAKLQKLLEEQQERERKAKEEQGKYEELYNETNAQLETYKQKAEQYEKVIEAYAKAELESLPEPVKKLLEKYESSYEKLQRLAELKEAGLVDLAAGNGKPTPDKNTPAGSTTGDSIQRNAYGVITFDYPSMKVKQQ